MKKIDMTMMGMKKKDIMMIGMKKKTRFTGSEDPICTSLASSPFSPQTIPLKKGETLEGR